MRIHRYVTILVLVATGATVVAAGQTASPSLTVDEVMTLLADQHLLATGGVQEAEVAQAILAAIDPKFCLAPVDTTSTGDVERAELWPTDIGYVKLRGLDEPGAKSLVATLKPWARTVKSGLILDLRGAGGSDLSALESVDAAFSRGAPVPVEVKGGDGVVLQHIPCGESRLPLFDVPVLVLVDGKTSGLCEVLAAVLKHYKGALLLGSPTMGDRALREWVTTRTGRKLYLATRWIDVCMLPRGVAVTPDVDLSKEPPIDHPMKPVKSDEGTNSVDVAPFEYPRENNMTTNIPQSVIDAGLLTDKAMGDPVILRALDVLKGLNVLGVLNPVRADDVPLSGSVSSGKP